MKRDIWHETKTELFREVKAGERTSRSKENMKQTIAIRPKEATQIPEPPIARFLFADTRMAWLWLIVRVYIGYQWLTAGLEKLTGRDFTIGASFGKVVSSPWVFGAHDGAAIKGFVMGALA
jgi:thiosulfate dehydrogenase (quinone) large subunit